MKNPYEKFQDFKNSQKAELGNLKKKQKTEFWNHEQMNVLKYKASNTENSIFVYFLNTQNLLSLLSIYAS